MLQKTGGSDTGSKSEHRQVVPSYVHTFKLSLSHTHTLSPPWTYLNVLGSELIMIKLKHTEHPWSWINAPQKQHVILVEKYPYLFFQSRSDFWLCKGEFTNKTFEMTSCEIGGGRGGSCVFPPIFRCFQHVFVRSYLFVEFRHFFSDFYLQTLVYPLRGYPI